MSVAKYNYTIDDSQWSTPPINLSEGWNMLRNGGSNEYIDIAGMETMVPLLGQFWNQSVSWTRVLGASTTIRFIGTDIWAYGMAGPDQGLYTISLDDRKSITYTAKADSVDYKHLLFSAHGLVDGEVHTLEMVNEAEGGSLVYDYFEVQTGTKDLYLPLIASPFKPTSTSQSPPSSTTLTLSTPNSPLGGLNLTQAGQAAGVQPVHQMTESQLSSLSKKYHFKWSPASYFVVVFSCLVLLTILGVIAFYLSSCFKKKRVEKRGSHTHPAMGKERIKARPNTRLLDALRLGKIGYPVPSEDGSIRRGSEGTTSTWEGRQKGDW